MNTCWLILRVLRLALWLATVGYFLHFFLYRSAHLTPFGHLLTTTELWMFGLPLAAVFAGFFELMMRERAGLLRPAIGRDWSGVPGISAVALNR
jgi:hypothetical protein